MLDEMEQYSTTRDISQTGEWEPHTLKWLDKKLKKCMSNIFRFLYEMEGIHAI